MPSLYRTRPAYRFTVEDSVYVAPDMHRRGIGKVLLERLIEACTALGFRQMIAVIGDSNQAASIGVHRACGFERCRQLARYRLEIRPLARHAADAASARQGRDDGPVAFASFRDAHERADPESDAHANFVPDSGFTLARPG